MSEQFFELDLATALGLPGHNDGLFALSKADRRHCLKLFLLFFRHNAFDHRAASVKINPENLNRPGQPDPSSSDQLTDPDFSPNPTGSAVYTGVEAV